jgi:ribosome biogenesis GTPase
MLYVEDCFRAFVRLPWRERKWRLPFGKILKGVGGLYSVAALGADEAGCTGRAVGAYLCSARGLFRKDGIKPLAGDEVDFEADPLRPEYGSIVNIRERRTVLERPPVSNVEQMLIVLTLSKPAPDFMLADKLAMSALARGVRPLVCVNKADLTSDPAGASEILGYERAGFAVIRASKERNLGYAELAAALGGSVTVFAGQSGAGKSTLFNGLLERGHMAVGDMSFRIGRGRHTTRHVELVRLAGGGYIVDSPGFSALEAEADTGGYRELDRLYPEFLQYRGKCRFAECSHLHEPGCAVLEALAGGGLHAGRHGRYAEFYAMLKSADESKFSKKRRRTQGMPDERA